jgi:hypothetical protein
MADGRSAISESTPPGRLAFGGGLEMIRAANDAGSAITVCVSLYLLATIDLAVREDFCLIASDGGIQAEPRANSHPRGARCFTAAVRYGLDHGIEFERILATMTSLPCEAWRSVCALANLRPCRRQRP